MRFDKSLGGCVALGAAWVAISVLGLTACSTGSRSSADDGGAVTVSTEVPGLGDAVTVPTTELPRREIVMQSIVDFGTVDNDGRVVVGWDAPEVDVGFSFGRDQRPAPAVMRFGPIASPETCIVEATLQVTVSTGSTSVPIAVYAGDPANVAAGDGEEVPSYHTVLDNRPRGTLELHGTTGTADVTELVRTWAMGGPFPSRGMTVDPASPLVLVVQPQAAVSRETFRLSMTESGPSTAPALTVSTNC